MRLIDADAYAKRLSELAKNAENNAMPMTAAQFKWTADDMKENAPTIGGWISVKDDLPKEHDSIFANHTHLSKHMWAKESDNVIVYVRFPDGTGRSTEGRLQDGKWWTRVSPMLEPVVTHWMPLPTPPEVKQDV